MKIQEVMTTDVVTVGEYRPFKEAVELMLAADVSGLPVVDANGHLVGIVTEADLISKEAYPPDRRRRTMRMLIDSVFAQNVGWTIKATGTTVGEVMTAEVAVTTPDEDVRAAARRMLERGVKRLPVVDAEGAVVGIVSRHDLLKVFRLSDDGLGEAVRKTLRRSLFVAPDHDITVTVKDGIVTLHGRVRRESDVSVAPAVARTVDGVVDVVTDLEFEEHDPKLERPVGSYP